MTRLETAMAELNGYKRQADGLLDKPQTTALFEECSILKQKLEALTSEMRIFRGVYGASDPDIKTSEETIQMLLCRLDPITSTSANLRDNHKLVYQEAGQWARHFSTVRMTVMTFTITTSALIIAWSWQSRVGNGGELSRELVSNPVGLLWILGLFVFWTFTQLTYRELSKQKYFRSLLVPSREGREEKPLPFDWASAAISTLCIFSVWLVFYYDTKMWSALKLLLLLIAVVSVIFCVLHRSWVKRK